VTRGITSTYTADLREVALDPVVLLEMQTTGGTWCRFTQNETDLSFNGSTFSARPFSVSEIGLDGDDQSGITLEFGNVDGYFDSRDFRKKKVNVYRADRDHLNATDCFLDTFRVVKRERLPGIAIYEASTLAAILSVIQVPARSLTREDFPAIPREGMVR
jgi:hypothetical protein